jgi:stage III sporulation protein AE
MKKILFFLLTTLLLLSLFSTAGAAEEALPDTETVPPEYVDFLESLPKELLELLPDGIFSRSCGELEDATQSMSHFSYLLKIVLALLGENLSVCLSLLATVCGLLLLSATVRALRENLRTDGIGRAFSFCAALTILCILITQGINCIHRVTDYFSALNTVTASLLPLMGILYAAGGNLTAAAASSAGLSVYMTLLEELVGKSILPFCAVCLILALINALDQNLKTVTLLSTVKKNYTTLLTFLMMLLLAMLSAQTVLGARSDTLIMRSAKFAAGNMIPVVGGSISELLRTVSAGVGYLRGTLGISAMLLLLLLLLPMVVELLLIRLTWQISASVAELLGCDSEKKLLEEFASLCGYLLAAVCICSTVVLLALTLLVRCASALG